MSTAKRRRRGTWTLMMLGSILAGEGLGFGAAALTSRATMASFEREVLHALQVIGIVLGCILLAAMFVLGLSVLVHIVAEDMTKGLPRTNDRE